MGLRPKVGKRVQYTVYIPPKESAKPGKSTHWSKSTYTGAVVDIVKKLRPGSNKL